MKTPVLVCFSVFVLFLFASCDLIGGGSGPIGDGSDPIVDGSDPTTNTSDEPISKEYWGTWIRMDTGEEYVINDKTVTVNGESSNGIGSITKESENILKYGSEDTAPRLFRKGGANRSFSAQLSGFENQLARAASMGTQGIKARRQNKNNESDKQEVESDSNGVITFTEAVSDEIQNIEVETASDTKVSVDVLPQYDGENVGTIPLITKGKYALKTTYTVNTKLDDYLYGNDYTEYDITLKFENISNERCAMSFYTISCDDANLKTTFTKEGNIRTLLPGKYAEITGKVSYGKLEEEYKDVTLNIKIEDGLTDDTWNDSVTLRFYKGRVPLVVNAQVVGGVNNSKLNGFVIYPDSRSKWFSVNSGESSTIWIPYSERDYTLVFSGATEISEMKYSFSYRNPSKLADLSGVVSRDEIRAYESNNTLDTAYNLGTFTDNIKAALIYGDLDYYKINNKNELVGNIASLKIDTSRMRTSYYLNQTLNTEGLVVKAVYQGGQEVDVSDSVKIGSIDMTTTGTKSLEISYTEDGITKSEKIYITVKEFTVSSIEIAQKPSKLIYYTEQKFDPSGIVVNATAPDGEIIDISNSVEYEGYNNASTGTQTITVILEKNGSRYRDTFTIEMKQLVLTGIRIDSKPAKLKYYSGQKINLAGLKVTALYNSGEEKEHTADCTNDFDSSNASDSKVVTVSYTENGITKTATFNVIIDSLPNNFTSVPVKITDPEITKNLSLGTEGEYYYFGDWPQSLAVNPPVHEEDGPAYHDWYIGDDGNFYAKYTAKNPYNYDKYFENGTKIEKGKTYFFKVEPIKWRVLTNNYNGTGKTLLWAENVLTTGSFDWTENLRSVGDDTKICSNNYKYSKMRAYLNGLDYYEAESDFSTVKKTYFTDKGFLQKAFTSTAQRKIVTTMVDNSVYNKDDSMDSCNAVEGFPSELTEEKVFLLNIKEVKTSDYGFAKDGDGSIPAYKKKRTDYAKASIAYGSNDTYFLRSPFRANVPQNPSDNPSSCCSLFEDGSNFITWGNVNEVEGIVPALIISF